MAINKKRLAIILIFTFVCTSEASMWDYFFGQKAQKNSVREELAHIKDDTYQNLKETCQEVVDFSNAAWDKMYDACEAAWSKFLGTKSKLVDSDEVESAVQLYEEAKQNLKNDVNKLADFLNEYKNSAEDILSETYHTSLEKLEEAVRNSNMKYEKSRDALFKLYDAAYDEAVEDYSTAIQYFSDSAEKLKTYLENKDVKVKQEIKKKLEDAKERAKENFNLAKKKYRDIKAKLEELNSEILVLLQSQRDTLKQWITNASNALKDFSTTLDETSGTYHSTLQRLQQAKDRVTRYLTEIEDQFIIINNRLSKFASDTIESIQQKYHDLKDEL